MSKAIYAEDEAYQLWYETINDQLFVHVHLTKVDSGSISRLKKDWDRMKEDAYMDGWDNIFTYTRDPRIVKIVGGSTEIGQDNADLVNLGYKVFQWELK